MILWQGSNKSKDVLLTWKGVLPMRDAQTVHSQGKSNALFPFQTLPVAKYLTQ